MHDQRSMHRNNLESMTRLILSLILDLRREEEFHLLQWDPVFTWTDQNCFHVALP